MAFGCEGGDVLTPFRPDLGFRAPGKRAVRASQRRRPNIEKSYDKLLVTIINCNDTKVNVPIGIFRSPRQVR